jgi:hypothetical protein
MSRINSLTSAASTMVALVTCAAAGKRGTGRALLQAVGYARVLALLARTHPIKTDTTANATFAKQQHNPTHSEAAGVSRTLRRAPASFFPSSGKTIAAAIKQISEE